MTDLPGKIRDAVRQIKNRRWIKGGMTLVREAERAERTCPECGHEHDTMPRYPTACAICGLSVLLWAGVGIRANRERREGSSDD